jgi:Flp pilus assembly pilin Flp
MHREVDVRTLWAWLADDRGDDLIEYALLVVTVGIAGAAVLSAFPGVINTIYTSWDNGQQGLWVPRDPQ